MKARLCMQDRPSTLRTLSVLSLTLGWCMADTHCHLIEGFAVFLNRQGAGRKEASPVRPRAERRGLHFAAPQLTFRHVEAQGDRVDMRPSRRPPSRCSQVG